MTSTIACAFAVVLIRNSAVALAVVSVQSVVREDVGRTPALNQWNIDVFEAHPLHERDKSIGSLEGPRSNFVFWRGSVSGRNKQLLIRVIFVDHTDDPDPIPNRSFFRRCGFAYNLSLISVLDERSE
ncbi:hypothetical protein [Neptunicoccus cionae]|uniref:hypothetical protein n=1 Tax=Neptunicoccus cionae TaxID=2035344 RepID=UPI00166605B7|nr:hypothetical protein [Amylibacter cionae]